MTASPENFDAEVPKLDIDILPYDYVAEIQQRFADKIYDPAKNIFETDRLLDRHLQWQEDGHVTVFTSGVFDMLHLDHAGYLLHTKATGAAVLYKQGGHRKPWESLESGEQQDFTSQALSEKRIRLIVSVDGDKSVAARKGFNVEKGGGLRPVYAWETRALTVASQAFIDPYDSERLLPTVDAVTVHGPHDFPAGHPHESHFSLAQKLQPDVWAVFGESKDVLDEVPRNKAFGSIALRCIQDGQGTHYYEDKFMGKMNTTKIVQRIMGQE